MLKLVQFHTKTPNLILTELAFKPRVTRNIEMQNS